MASLIESPNATPSAETLNPTLQNPICHEPIFVAFPEIKHPLNVSEVVISFQRSSTLAMVTLERFEVNLLPFSGASSSDPPQVEFTDEFISTTTKLEVSKPPKTQYVKPTTEPNDQTDVEMQYHSMGEPVELSKFDKAVEVTTSKKLVTFC